MNAQEEADFGLLNNELERYSLLTRKAKLSVNSAISYCEGAVFGLKRSNQTYEASIMQYIIDRLIPAEDALNEMITEQIRKDRQP